MGPSGVHCKVTKYLRLWQTISWRLAEYPYIIIIVFGGVILSLMGMELSEGFFCALQAISNTGLGSDATGVNGDYSLVSDGAKWLLSFIMLVGRLEIFTILLLFTGSFWRK